LLSLCLLLPTAVTSTSRGDLLFVVDGDVEQEGRREMKESDAPINKSEEAAGSKSRRGERASRDVENEATKPERSSARRGRRAFRSPTEGTSTVP